MTRAWKAETTQTGIHGWIRNNPNLDSVRAGLTVMDSDLWVHRYKTEGGREFQFLMLVEIKEFGKDMDRSQRDTLHIINQLLRNRRNVRPEWNADECDGRPRITRVHSLISNQTVSVLCYGAHRLSVHGDGTYTQWNRLTWDNKKEISYEQLEQLLRFELDPDTLGKLDHRPDQRHPCVLRTDKTDLGFDVDVEIFPATTSIEATQ